MEGARRGEREGRMFDWRQALGAEGNENEEKRRVFRPPTPLRTVSGIAQRLGRIRGSALSEAASLQVFVKKSNACGRDRASRSIAVSCSELGHKRRKNRADHFCAESG